MPVLETAFCLSSLAGTPVPVSFPILVRPVALPESWPVFGYECFLVSWLGIGPPVSEGGIRSLLTIGTGQLFPNRYCSPRTPPLGVIHPSRSEGIWHNLEDTAPWHYWSFPSDNQSKGSRGLKASAWFLVARRHSPNVEIQSVVLGWRYMSMVNRIDTTCVW